MKINNELLLVFRLITLILIFLFLLPDPVKGNCPYCEYYISDPGTGKNHYKLKSNSQDRTAFNENKTKKPDLTSYAVISKQLFRDFGNEIDFHLVLSSSLIQTPEQKVLYSLKYPLLPDLPEISNSVNGNIEVTYYELNTPATEYHLTASNLTDSLIISASTIASDPENCNLAVSFLSNGVFTSRLALSPVNGFIDTTIFVKPDCTEAPVTCEGTITHSSSGVISDLINVQLGNNYTFQFAPVVTLGQVRSEPLSLVYVPITSVDFSGIGELGFYINYDSTVLNYIGIGNVHAELPGNICFDCLDPDICCENPDSYITYYLTNNDSVSKSLFIGIRNDSNLIDVPDGEKLLDLIFSYSNGYTDLSISGNCYYSGNDTFASPEIINQPLNNYYINGSVGPFNPKTIILDIFLEGLYNPYTELMNHSVGSYFPEDVADLIAVSLAGSFYPYPLEYESDSLYLYTNGFCQLEIPYNYNDDYYLVINNRNSIETWSKYPVSFSQDTIFYSFTDNINKAYNSNLLPIGDKYCIYNGDVNKDGFIDSGDMSILDNESSQFITGYNQSDVNGDFITDTGDLSIVDNNALYFIMEHRPIYPNPELVTKEISEVSYNSAIVEGVVIATGLTPVYTKGICWDTLPYPTIANPFENGGSGLGPFTCQLSDLLPATTYYTRAFAANENELAYGNHLVFSTPALLPSITTTELSEILDESVTSGGIISNDGGAQILQRGVCWSTDTMPTIEDNFTIDGVGHGSFVSHITGLIPYTTYYLRAYATNEAGTGYGNVVEFTTLIPAEITDGNNYAHYIFTENSNVKDGNNLLSQLRDITLGNAIGIDVYNGAGEFNSLSGWSLASGWSISNGKLNGLAGGGGSIYRSSVATIANAVYNMNYTIDSISGSWVRNINCYPLINRTSPGTFSQNVISVNGYLSLNKNSATKCKIDNFTLNRIAGNHLVQYTATNQPIVRSTYLQFDGVDNFLRTAIGADSIGTIYIVAQRDGIDTGFVVLNNFTGIGQYLNKRLTIGGNDAGSAFYSIKVKEILIRTGNDTQAIQHKLNAYFEKKQQIDGWDVPLGKTITPATNPTARQFIVSLCDDDATEGAYPQDTTTADYPYNGGYYTRLHPVIVAAKRYLLENNLIQEGEEIAPCECTYIQNRLSLNPAQVNYYERGFHLKCLQDLYGWEIASHTASHGGFIAALDNEIIAEAEINGCRQTLINDYGFNIQTIVWPIGYHSHLTRLKAAEQHKCGISVGGTFAGVTNHNTPPLNHFAISRKTFDYMNCDANGNLINPAAALAYMKGCVDEANDENGWLISMSHIGAYFWKNHNSLFPDPTYPPEWIIPCPKLPSDWQNSNNHIVPEGWYPYPNSLLDCLYKTIIYIYEQGGRIVLPRDGIDIYGNESTNGDVTWGVKGFGAVGDQLNYEHNAVGIDGSISSYREE